MTIDITDATLFTMQGALELIHDAEYVGKKGYELRKVQLKKENGDIAEFEFFGQDIPNDIEDFRAGEAVTVSFTIQQREYNGRTFTKLSGKGITRNVAGAAAPVQEEAVEDHEMPF